MTEQAKPLISKAETEAHMALACLFVEVADDIAQDVKRKVEAALVEKDKRIEDLERENGMRFDENTRLRKRIAEMEARCTG